MIQRKNFTTINLLILFNIVFFCTAYTTISFSKESDKQSFESVEERRIYSLMQKERDKLSAEKKDLLLREKELKTLETSVDKKIAEIDSKLEELKGLQKRIETLLEEKSKEETKRIKDLSAIYEKMVPAKAALAMTSMDPNLATEILGNMKPKSAAKVMDMLDKNKTSQLSTTFTTIQIE
jgi:flagellar motility protein MotE (MotC chaperone)